MKDENQSRWEHIMRDAPESSSHLLDMSSSSLAREVNALWMSVESSLSAVVGLGSRSRITSPSAIATFAFAGVAPDSPPELEVLGASDVAGFSSSTFFFLLHSEASRPFHLQ